MKKENYLKALLVVIKATANKCKEPEEHIILELIGYLSGRVAGEFAHELKNEKRK